MNKILILPTSCLDEFTSDFPCVFAVTITDTLCEQIKLLAGTCTTTCANTIETFNHDGIWSEALVDLDEVKEENINTVLASIDKSESRIEMSQLCVTKTAFKFTAVPKYLGDDMLLSTPYIGISALGNETLLVRTAY
ncbi:MAG: hypothetical protein HRT35_14940 [Algicola sp.]|nr:hypothetical protein [Algicola sp.]